MIENSKKVAFPDELINDMNIEGTIFSDSNEQVGIATLSERDGSNHILRIFQLLYNDKDEIYEPSQELAAFTFQDRNELTRFLERLPSISGLEMLILLNPLTFNQGQYN